MRTILVILLFYWVALPLIAQNTYTDYKPEYKKWHPDYMIDKIEYTPTRMIIHFRYVANSINEEVESKFGNFKFYTITRVTFFGKTHPERWYLENYYNPDETYHFVDIKNIRRNGQLMESSISGYEQLDYHNIKANEVFTCEIHFKRLPKHVKKVSLYEGEDYKHDKNHFHVLQIKVKQEDDKDLGEFSDMVKRVQEFERKLTGRPRSTFSVPKKDTPAPAPMVKKEENTSTPPQPIVKKQVPPPQPTFKPRLHSPPVPPAYPQEAQARM
ncbi:MAG: hypothetical protein RMJ97_07315 [Raineya sp.]|nr:hypothetical protein [Raineya sp.]MDW8296679.1 hypothetical protein [Raineya sp.]